MTKREIQQQARREFFEQVERKYPISSIEVEMGGRWTLIFKDGLMFDLSCISYGGQIDSYVNLGSERYEEVLKIETELQAMWDKIYQG